MNAIELRRPRKTDAPEIYRLLNNKKVWDNLRDLIPFPYSLQDAEDFIAFTEEESPAQTFVIVAENGGVCGIIGLVAQKDVYRLSAEIGYWVGEEFWGKGIATRAIKLITEYGFEQLNLERIYAGIFDYNGASMRALEKNDFAKEGVFRNSIVKNGTIYDEHRYAKLKHE